MVLYFTGTGNSKYVAQRIAAALGDTLFCMNDRIRAGDPSPVETGRRLVIVTPTYAWRIPRLVRDWLRSTELRGAEQAWFVMTCGSEIGSADKYNRALCAEKELACMGTGQIVMPENYIAMFDAPQADKARRIVAKAEPDIDRAIAAIKESRAFAPTRRNLYDRFMSGPVNPAAAPPTASRCAAASPSGARAAPTAWPASATAPRRLLNTGKRVSASRGITLRRCENSGCKGLRAVEAGETIPKLRDHKL